MTGGAGGIGYAIAEKLAGEGVSVVLADVSAESEQKAEQLRAKGYKAMFIHTDISDEKSTEAMASEAIRSFGSIDILINNAGIYPRAHLLETTVEMWDRVMDINLKGMFLGCVAKIIIDSLNNRL